MRAKIGVLFTVFLLLVSCALAQEIVEPGQINIDVVPVKDAISAGGVAVFDVTITNNMRFDDTFNLKFSNDVEWTILTTPLNYKFSNFKLAVGESANFKVNIRASPSAGLGYNLYVIGLTITAKATHQEEYERLTFGYGPQFLTPKQYAALITASIDIPEEVDPRTDMQIRVHLRNRNPLNITNLEIRATSETVSKSMMIDLAPLEEKDVYLTQEINNFESPKQELLVVEILREDIVLISIERSFEIIPYSEFDSDITSKESFLRNVHTIDVVNEGNYKAEDQVRYETKLWNALFSSTKPRANLVKEDGQRYLEWTLELEPDEQVQLRVVENYWILVFLIVLGVTGFVTYQKLKSPLVIKKNAIVVATKEGGISGIKIMLTVVNRSNRTVSGVKLVDSVPNIATVEKKHEVGVLAPEKIVKHARKGTLLKWNLGDMGGGEERVLSYKVKSRLTILGSFTLPAAVTKFSVKGKGRVVYSNRLRMST